ncbi:TnsD family Tn7-like transposition protein [Cupriavidus necator]
MFLEVCGERTAERFSSVKPVPPSREVARNTQPKQSAVSPRSRVTEHRSQIRKLLERDFTPKQVAALLRIRVDRVYYEVRREGELRLRITELRVARERMKRRRAWTRAIARWPDRTTNYVRKRRPRDYRWLYENDREWLSRHGTGVRTWSSGHKPHARPYGADAMLAGSIVRIGKAVRKKLPPMRCSRRRLVVETGLTEWEFQRALSWKRVAKAFAESVESTAEFRMRARHRRAESDRCSCRSADEND